MLKKSTGIFALLVLLVAFTSWAATTWQIQTKLSNAGGTIKVRGIDKSTVGVTVMNNYTTSTGVIPVVVTPNTGYKIATVTRGGVAQLIADPAAGFSATFQKSGGTNQSLVATFASQQIMVSGTAGPNGSISPAQTAISYGGSATVTVTPLNGSTLVSSITPATATIKDINGNTVVLPYAGTVKATVSNVTDNTVIAATFSTASANAGATQTVQTNSSVTLSGSVTLGTSHLWSQVSGPVATLSDTASLTPTFTPTVAGTYVFQLVNKQGATIVASSTTQVVASSSLVNALKIQCIQCHTGATATAVSAAFAKWSSSTHVSRAVTCVTCHGTSMPNPNMSPSVCNTCHVDLSAHPIDIATNACVTCHNPHSQVATVASAQGAPHYNNITGGMYPASYMTSKADCANCHNSKPGNRAIRQQWAASGHAATTALPWIDYDFKTRTECVRCHTTTGFIAYSTAKVTAAWGLASDKTKEVLTCVGCHSDVAAGTVRTVTPNKPFADETGYTNRNVGPSNICMDCHSGRNNGQSIQVKVGTADFSNLSYIAPHYLTAGGTLHGKSGYQFPGRTYADYSGSSHRKIGMTNTNTTGTDGPCVTCHMSAPNKHAFKSVSSANGAIAAITTTVCTNCHNASMPAATLDAKQVEFTTALNILKIQLQDKGFAYSPNYPYFAAKNWGTGQAGANVMGAAFNYKLFVAEPGAYAHYPLYAKQLIVDSIDAVFNNGTVTGNIDSALNDLYGKGLISAEQRTSLNTYKNPDSSCSSCHGNPPASGTHVENAVTSGTCANCHTYTGPSGVTHNNGVVDINMTCNSCHGNPPLILTAAHSGHTGTHTTATDCATCHGVNPGAPGHNNGALATTCVACHGNPPTALTVALSGHTGTHTAATDCATCHGAGAGSDATHKNGAINTTCVACHGNPPAALTVALSGHTGIHTSATDCATCHGANPGATGHNNGALATTCVACHGNPPAALTVALSGHTGAHTSATDCATCHGANPGAPGHNNGTLATTCVACHGNPPTALTVALSGHTGAHTTATDCATCHGANPGAPGHNNGALATTCVACHGNPPTTQTIHTSGSVQYTHSTPNTVYSDCTACHDSTHRNGTVDLKTNATACSSCHSYPPATTAHSSATTSPQNCANCHTYNGYGSSPHNDGSLNLINLTCDMCHGYPPMSAAQFSARVEGTYVNAKVEDYPGGGGYHSSHLLPTVSAAEGFTPCLPCHPSSNHAQGGGTVVQANVNVFDAADTSFRLNSALPKTYTASTCSNVSCHFKTSPAWNQ